MESYKQEFIDFLLRTGALQVGLDKTLKSGRISPYFVNIGISMMGKPLHSLVLHTPRQ